MLDSKYYEEWRKPYEPEAGKVKCIFIFESPPSGGNYFYRTDIPPGTFFREIIRTTLGIDKKEDQKKYETGSLLSMFRSKGFLLLDATYKQINGLKGKPYSDAISSGYSYLAEELARISPDQSAKIICASVEVCNLLLGRLRKDGWQVINKGNIPFAGNGNQKTFRDEVRKLLKENNLD